jgi:glycosidase
MTFAERLLERLTFLYGENEARALLPELEARLDAFRRSTGPASREGTGLTERDAMLITYGDQVDEPGAPPLRTLETFCTRHLPGLVNCLHVLPFFPYSSDDGFSIIDYRRVDPSLGTWDDISRLGVRFRLMFDAVVNHASVQSDWFRAFLRDESPYNEYFITVQGNPDLSQVVRPRALPLLTRFGEKAVWTTFSADQADLNYHNPRVLLEVIDLLLFYIAHGASFLRLDAIAFLWKEIGTSCIHLPQTHAIVQLIHAVLDEVAPGVKLITETNVPHRENLSYFGDGTNEAHLVYNFALPPLVLHTFQAGDARALTRWARDLALPSDRVTFFNFLASHDGIGLLPARGILSGAEIDSLVRCTRECGGLASYKLNPDGSQSPYELNVNYFDALSDPGGGGSQEAQIDRFMAAQAVMLALVGVPGIYFHSLFGSRGWPEGVRETGRNRAINRRKLTRAELERELADPASLRSRIYAHYARLLRARAASPAFHPHGTQRTLDCGPAVFALLRELPAGDARVLALQNVTPRSQTVSVDADDLVGLPRQTWTDLVSGRHVALLEGSILHLMPYQTCWLIPDG